VHQWSGEKRTVKILFAMDITVLLSSFIHRKPLGVRGWSSLYTISYQMVNLSITSGELLYERICAFVDQYVNSASVQDIAANASLCEFIAVWQSYKIMTKWIWHLFMHLESSVIKLNESLTLTSVALVNFRRAVYEPFHGHLTSLALSTIEREREGEIVDRSLLQETLQVGTLCAVVSVVVVLTFPDVLPVQIFLAMGLASKIDSTFGSEKRDSLKNIDSALKLQEFRGLYLQHIEAAFLEVSSG
jgi:hypothetical protein